MPFELNPDTIVLTDDDRRVCYGLAAGDDGAAVVRIDGAPRTPEEISAEVLRHLVAVAERDLGVRTAGDRGIPILEISRLELDRMTGGVLHQGVGLQVPPFAYQPFDDLLAAALEQPAPLLVALDGVTDPRNLGAVIRSAAAFGAQGIFVPERRAAGITATAWRTSAGAAARMPVSPRRKRT